MANESHHLLRRMLPSLLIISLLGLATTISLLATANAGITQAATTDSSSPVPASANQPPQASDADTTNALPPPPTDANGQPLPPEGLPTSWTTNLSATLPSQDNNLPGVFGCSGSDTFTTSRDSNPYPVCPGPMPASGGNCTWWAWESWHRLGVNLPGWGNAELWANAAARAGYKIGTVPRLNAIAVFPVGDGVWAFSAAGHVAFVTQVYSDHDTFDVTFQNYGDPTVEHFGYHYRVSLIQQPQFQHGQMRFIYFPGSKGPVGNSTPPTQPTTPPSATQPTATPTAPPATPTPPPDPTTTPSFASADLYSGNFAGDGRQEVLRYNRAAGTLDLLALTADGANVHITPLGDSTTAAGQWGKAWEVYIGDLTGEGRDTLLLFDRAHGVARFIRFNADLSVAGDIQHTDWKSTWDIFVGRFGNTHDDLLLYDRQLNQDHGQYTPTPDEVSSGQNGAPDKNTPSDWQHLHRTATLTLVDYAPDFSVHQEVTFANWHNTWEVHPGSFGAEHNGVLLIDRQAGEARILTFTPQMKIAHTYSGHHWNIKWEVTLGDFNGAGQDGLLLFDRSMGTVRLLGFTPTLALARSVTYTNWARGWAFYPGNWGGAASAATSLFLYDPKQGRAAFVSFGPHLEMGDSVLYQSWRHGWQVFVGRFSTPCPAAGQGASAASCPSEVWLIDAQHGQAKLVHFQFADQSAAQPTYNETPLGWQH